MTTPSSGPSGFDDAQVNSGGADAVEKTSYVTGRGTEPEEAQRPERARIPGGARPTGLSPAGWALIAVALLFAVFFGFAIFR